MTRPVRDQLPNRTLANTQLTKNQHTGTQTLTILDILAIVFAFAVSVLLFVLSLSGATSSTKVEITTATDNFVYDLSQDRLLEFEGPVGLTRVEIANNSIRVTESPGRQQICVKAGEIQQNGEWLACLPNKIFIRIFGTNKKNIDVLSF